jgi:hypothetical protein
MPDSEFEAEIAAFIRSNGITRCPTACVVRTQGTPGEADRQALQQRAVEQENNRKRRRQPLAFGKNTRNRSRMTLSGMSVAGPVAEPVATIEIP